MYLVFKYKFQLFCVYVLFYKDVEYKGLFYKDVKYKGLFYKDVEYKEVVSFRFYRKNQLLVGMASGYFFQFGVLGMQGNCF